MDDRSRPVVPHSSEIPYQAIVDTMNDALVIVDENQVITYANHSFMELIGYRLEDIIGRHVKDFLDEENWHKVQEHIKKRRGGYSTQYELEWTHWTGDRVQTIVSATPIFEKGEYRGSFGVITDITALRLEQEKRLRTERRFRVILEAMNEAVAFVDGELRVQYGNNRLFEMLGYTPEEVLGKSALNYVDTSGRETIRRFVLRSGEETRKTYELTLISKSGERVHALVTPRPIYDDGGQLIGIIGMLLDVSELKRVYSLMKETEARYESLFKEMPVGLISIRADGKVLNANERAAEILGAPSADALFEIDFLQSPASKASGIPEALQKCIQTKSLVVGEAPFKTLWGKEGHGTYRLYPRLDEDGNVVEILGVFDEITERKRMEEALRESERKYRDLAEDSLQGISIIQDQRYVYVNNTFCEIVGRTREEILSMSPEEAWAMIHPEDRPRLLKFAEDRRAGREVPVPYTYRFVRPDGSVRWVEAFSNYIEFQGRRALQVIVIDVTERKRVQDKLKESQEMLSLVIETIPQFVYWKDKESRYIGCNANFARVAGVESPEEIVGKTDYDLAWTREQAEAYIKTDREVIETGQPIHGLVEKQLQAGGRERWIETTKVPLHDARGEIIGVLGTFQDITERREREDAIRKSEEKYRTLAEGSLQGLAIVSSDRIEYANRSLLRMIGRTLEELCSMSLDDATSLIHPEDREEVVQNFMKKINGEPAPSNLEFRVITQHGNIRWMEAFTSLIEFEGKPAIQVVFIDMTERRKAEREVRSARDRAELYLDLMSHDIRNHLQVIVSSAALLRTAADEATKDSFFQIMMDSIQRVSRLIDEVRATEELASVPLEPRNLTKAVERCVNALAKSSTQAHFEMSIECEDAEVMADSYLEFLVTNILMNAVEHNPNDDKRVWVRVYKDGGGYTISIADNGPGVPDGAKESLFDRARRFGGLGLHQSQQIADKYGGKIMVFDRVPGDYSQGAEFRIWIPRAHRKETT